MQAMLPKSLVGNPRLGSWVGFETAGQVRIATGKIELGQGVLTAFVQIAAEELDVAPERIDLVSGQTAESPDEGTTSGSNSVAVGGAAIRFACAAVRMLFIRRLAEQLNVDPSSVRIDDGSFLCDGEASGEDYWSLTSEIDLDRSISAIPAIKPSSSYRIVGHAFPRIDLAEKLTGPAFVHDLAPKGMLHARMLRQPTRAARLISLDETAVARAARGPLKILREGSLVALVSENETTVLRALAAARGLAVWDHRSLVPDDLAEPQTLTAQPAETRIIEEGTSSALQGNRVIEMRFSKPFLFHGSIGPSCAVAAYDGNDLKVWTHSQDVFSIRRWVARTLGIPLDQIGVFHAQGAGAYGHNSADDAAFDAAFVATRLPGSPIRVQWMREDEFSCAPPVGAAMTVDLRAALDTDNRPLDWTIEIWSPVHGRRPGNNGMANFLGADAMADALPVYDIADTSDAVGGGGTRNARAYYDLPNHRIVHHLLREVPIRTSSMRGLGAFTNIFAIESFMDELAEAADEDPVAYRLSLSSDRRARRVMEKAASMAGWPSPSKDDSALGFAFGRYKNIAAYVAVVAEITVGEEVQVRRVWAAVDAGLVINPDGAVNQIEGGIVQATSWALKEQVRFEDGRVASVDWHSYPILRFSETPEVFVEFVPADEEPTLGVGEAAQGPTAGAIGNALKRALGTRITGLPFSRERIMAALLQ